jgi:heavy metal sensor kinase
MTSAPIRIRLALWYSAVLAFSLSLFALVAFEELRRSLLSAVDDELRDRTNGFRLLAQHDADDFVDHLLPHVGSQDLLQLANADGGWTFRTTAMARADVPMAFGPLGEERFSSAVTKDGPLRLLTTGVEIGGHVYRLQVAQPMAEYERAVKHLGFTLLVAAPLFLIAASLGGYWMSRRALVPVDRITREARAISAGSLSSRLEVPAADDELRRLSLTLNEMLERLESAFQRVARFTGDASHELRTPLALMRSMAEVALRRPRAEADSREVLVQVLRELQRMSALVEDLLLLARADSPWHAPRRDRIDLVTTLREACGRGRTMAEAKRIQFSEELAAPPLWVEGDGTSLERAFLILIDNAVKYTPTGRAVHVVLVRAGGTALAEVRDTGIGIAADDLPHLFERFYRADKARSRESGGTGLGLAIGRWIVEAHGGQLDVTSSLGQGSVFSVRLPLAPAA